MGLAADFCTIVRINNNTCAEVTPYPALADGGTALVKVTCAPGGCTYATGAIVVVGGGPGDVFYDTELRYGINVLAPVNQNGFNIVQIAFNNFGYRTAGWQSGPSLDGPRTLACTYATIAKWAKDLYAPSKPFCATGHSSGTSALAYAMSIYGFGCDPADSRCTTDNTRPVFSLAEPASGPPHARVDIGCSPATPEGLPVNACGGPLHDDSHKVQQSYVGDAKFLIDPSYWGTQQPSCETCVNGGACNNTLWQQDSILESSSDGGPFTSFPHTEIRPLFGCLDTSAAASLGNLWVKAVTGKTGPQVGLCVPDAGHAIADVIDGGQMISADLNQYCKLN